MNVNSQKYISKNKLLKKRNNFVAELTILKINPLVKWASFLDCGVVLFEI